MTKKQMQAYIRNEYNGTFVTLLRKLIGKLLTSYESVCVCSGYEKLFADILNMVASCLYVCVGCTVPCTLYNVHAMMKKFP